MVAARGRRHFGRGGQDRVDWLALRRTEIALGGATGTVFGDGRGRGIRVNGETPQYGEVRYFVGGTIRAYERPEGVTFGPGLTSSAVVDQDGDTWQVTEEALVSPTGEVAPRMFGQLLYWFGWRAFHPHTAVYESVHATAGP